MNIWFKPHTSRFQSESQFEIFRLEQITGIFYFCLYHKLNTNTFMNLRAYIAGFYTFSGN